ncbi:hypothetical protein MUK42_36488 [Musa troglodytarum]|uniref:Uncharacterized protein n=1 Tax=Musa troglodytarum TaxID=320322 RepID=A0A9E7EH03_9LILI|nr:hypothetical protein MUK42_36488 [Musa troglodytarum]
MQCSHEASVYGQLLHNLCFQHSVLLPFFSFAVFLLHGSLVGSFTAVFVVSAYVLWWLNRTLQHYAQSLISWLSRSFFPLSLGII